MKSYGFIPSLITPVTIRYKAPQSKPLPERFSYRPFLSPVTNQGDYPFCIPHSVACWLNWRENMKKGTKKDFNIKYADIYYSKNSSGSGMTYMDAFDFLKKKGVKSDKGKLKISTVAYIPNMTWLKAAIIANGPCFGALPVYDPDSNTFWKRTGSKLQGWHSITIVGWNEKGYIIRNSWGVGYGDKGYEVVPYEEESSFKELWTILG